MSWSKDNPYPYLSLGAGTQSSALLVLACEGELDPTPEVAIFADTGSEPPWVYEFLEALKAYSSIPIEVVTIGSLLEALDAKEGKRWLTIPGYTLGPDGRSAPVRRKCTKEYKIEPITKRVRELMGYKPRQRIPKDSALCYLGISIEESDRMKANRDPWATNRWPLVERALTRSACRQIVVDAGLPEPCKSSCTICPYHSNDYWVWLKVNHPEQWEQACLVDESIRDARTAGVELPIFLHRSLKPLREAPIGSERQGQLDFLGCEEGHCGV